MTVEETLAGYLDFRRRMDAGEETDWSKLSAYFTDDAVYIDPAWGRVEGIDKITEFFSDHYPDIALLSAAAPSNGAGLVAHRDERSLAADNAAGDSSHVLVLERLLDLYRITNAKIDLKGF